MYKNLKFKSLLFAMVLSIIITSVPMTALATIESYETNATPSTGVYAVIEDGVTTHSYDDTTYKGKALKEMRTKALYRWQYPGNTQTYYYPYYGSASPDPIWLYHLNSDNEVQQYRGILYEKKAANKNNMSEASREHWLGSATAIENAITAMLSYSLPDPDHDTTSLRRSVRGTDCSSSVCYAWRAATNHNTSSSGVLMSTVGHNNSSDPFYYTYTCAKIVKDGYDTNANNADGYGNYVDYVGNYTTTKTYTNQVLDELDDSNVNIYQNIYAQIRPGDFLVQYTPNGSHARLVEKVIIVHNDNNTINPYKSYVVVTEQTSSKKHCTNNAYSTDEKKYYDTTWYVKFDGGEYNGTLDTYKRYNFFRLAGKNASGTQHFYLPFRYNYNYANPVTGFIPGNITDSQIEINWTEQDPNSCNGFELMYATDADFKDAQTIVFDSPQKNSYTLKNLEKGKIYYIKMRAYVFHKDGKKEYSGYNNWLRINPATKEIYRQNAPNPKDVSQKEYKEYIYDDISYDYELDN